MGLWDTLKGAVQTITGGAAKVQVEVGEATLGAPVFVRITALAEANVEIQGVYVLVRAHEEAEVRDVDYDYDDGSRRIEYVRGHHQTFSSRFDIAGAQSLESGQSYTWEGEFVIPDDNNPSFDGHLIGHTWQLQAGLDAPGNDPDSGWLEFDVWDN